MAEVETSDSPRWIDLHSRRDPRRSWQVQVQFAAQPLSDVARGALCAARRPAQAASQVRPSSLRVTRNGACALRRIGSGASSPAALFALRSAFPLQRLPSSVMVI
jgi:hypothetical protein